MKIIFWLPRILSVGFAAFLSLFALDAFSGQGGWEAVGGFLIHLIPALIMLAAALVAWKYDWFGMIAFWGWAVFYVIMVGPGRPGSWYLLIAGPAGAIGLFFLLSWRQKRQSRARTKPSSSQD